MSPYSIRKPLFCKGLRGRTLSRIAVERLALGGRNMTDSLGRSNIGLGKTEIKHILLIHKVVHKGLGVIYVLKPESMA
jgi:hypothetical protein